MRRPHVVARRPMMSEPTKNPSNPARTAARSTKRVATAKHVLPPSEGGQAVPDASSLAQLLMVSDWTSAQEVDAILDAAPDSVVVYDAEGRIVRANATFHIFL